MSSQVILSTTNSSSNLKEGSIFFVGNATLLIFRWFYYLIVGFL
ncbi:MAG: hypothetical protein ACR2F1_02905 [Nitrososphaeraceae archaeon]